jgi:hypothetical protein
LSPIRTTLAIFAIALLVPAAIAGCGGDDDGGSTDEDPQTVIDETFNNDQTVSSGNVTMSASISAEGEQGGSFEGSLSGPYQSNPEDPTAVPQLDWTVSASGEGAGAAVGDFSAGLVITEDNAFVEYNDEAYEVGTEQFAQLKESYEAQTEGATDAEGASFQDACAQAVEQAGGDPTAACDIDPTTWLTDLTNEGTEDVGGTDSIHIHGNADVQQMLTDIGELVAAVPSAGAQGFDPSQLGLLSGAVSDATVDVYSTVDDHLLSKIEVALALDLSALGAAASAVPVETLDLDFTVEIADINEEQTIEAPTDAKPIDELTEGFDIGGLGGLGGLGGTEPPSSGSGGGGATDPSAYLDCLEQAATPKAIEASAAQH